MLLYNPYFTYERTLRAGALSAFVKAFLRSRDVTLQQHSLGALGTLAYLDRTGQILNEEGALAGIVEALSVLNLQYLAKRTLLCLVGKTDDRNILTGIVDGLLSDNPDWQCRAARIVEYLARSRDSSIKQKLESKKRIVTYLVKHLLADNSLFREHTASALATLAKTGSASMKEKILRERGCFEGLVACMFADKSPTLQKVAVDALMNLADNDHIKGVMAYKYGLLPGLVKRLSELDNPELMYYAANALQILSSTENSLILERIGCEKGVLGGLVRCLAET